MLNCCHIALIGSAKSWHALVIGKKISHCDEIDDFLLLYGSGSRSPAVCKLKVKEIKSRVVVIVHVGIVNMSLGHKLPSFLHAINLILTLA